MWMKNKKGFLSVYLCLFFLAMVSVILLVIGAVRTSVWQSNGEALGQLWAHSILAEYDVNLQQRYGLFGYYGYPAMVKDKLDFYGQETFGNASLKKNQNRISWEIRNCSNYAYALQNVDTFKRQILADGAYRLIQKEKTMVHITPVKDHTGGNLETLFQELPSSGMKSSLDLDKIADLLKRRGSLEERIKKGSQRQMEIAYAFAHFNHRLEPEAVGESYFFQEIEYLICGKQSETKLEKGIRNRIIAAREGVNLIYLNENPKTRNEALAIAEVLTPGPAAVATQQTLLSAWALAESVNDYWLLINGHKVPLMKTDATWAIDLETVLENTEEGYIYTGVDEGDDYETYLQFLLSLVDERLFLLRMMDLMQINMRWFYYDEFLLNAYYGGVQFDLMVEGKTHRVEMEYVYEE